MWPSWKRDTRAREGDPDLWGALYDRFATDPSGAPRPPRQAGPISGDSKARLIDAALGIVGSVRVFVEVAEDVLLDQRERLRQPSPAREEPVAPHHEPSFRDRARPPVQDIPMETP